MGSNEFVVFSFPVRRRELPEGLTSSERHVVEGLLGGLSNAEIAARRGTAIRTVANQVASIFRKLRISSRAELAARLEELCGTR